MSNITVQTPKELLAYLEKSRSAVNMALPKHLNADRMMRLALTAFSTSAELRSCSPQSILSSIVVASQLGLEPGVAGQGYLVPYKGTCTFVPGWQGLVGLLNNTGRATAWTQCVYEGDTFQHELGSSPKITHIPGPNFGDDELITWAYACGKVNGSEMPVIEAWPKNRIWKHRDKHNKLKNPEKHYSFRHPEMYARKVVLLQVLKYMPRSIELNNAIAAANAAENGNACIVDNGVIVEVESTDVEVNATERKATPAAPEKKPAAGPARTPQQELETVVYEAGFDFDAFLKWAKGSGQIAETVEMGDFSQLPADHAARLLRAKSGLLSGLKAVAK